MKLDYCLAILTCGALAAFPLSATADEPVKECPDAKCPASQCPALREIPLLTKFPYLNQLFRNADCPVANDFDCPAASAATMLPRIWRMVGPDGIERIGVDFDFQLTGATQPAAEDGAAGQGPAKQCVANQCPSKGNVANNCPADCRPCLPGKVAGEHCEAAPLALGPSSLGFAGPFPGPVAISPPWGMPAPADDGLLSVLEEMRRQFDECERELLLRLADARVAAATARTKLKGQQELAAKEAAFAKELLAAQLENAKLAARLELAEEKEKLASELRQAQSELTVLKAQLEVASLKARLADRTAEEATASRPASRTTR